MSKQCQVCLTKIPEDYQNLLCLKCYDRQTKENELKKKEEAEQIKKRVLLHPQIAVGEKPMVPFKNGITDPNYTENPEQADKPQWQANIVQFTKSGHMLWPSTRYMYEFIRNYNIRKVTEHPQYPKFKWLPTIVDVGCGCGAGSNVLSQESSFVWGIDKNQVSIDFANECFKRYRNGIFYSPQVSFDRVDILKDDREFMRFDQVVAIEIIEHIDDYKRFLTQIINKFAKHKKGTFRVQEPTEFFISTPNRNNKGIRQDRPYNKYHCREWTQEEFVKVLSEFFEKIEIMNAKGEPVGSKNDHTPILAKTGIPKLPVK